MLKCNKEWVNNERIKHPLLSESYGLPQSMFTGRQCIYHPSRQGRDLFQERRTVISAVSNDPVKHLSTSSYGLSEFTIFGHVFAGLDR